MKAMTLASHAPVDSRPLKATNAPDPTPRDGEMLVAVTACGVCRTDLHLVEGELPPARLPIIPGHQIVGRVERAPAGCGFQTGDRVGIAWLRHTCGSCSWCLSARENLCDTKRFTGYQEHGGYAELATVNPEFAYRIPDGFDDVHAAPLLCAGIIGYRALVRAQLPKGGTLGIFGFGSSASLTMQIAAARGSEVFVASRSQLHQELARDLGASWAGEVRERLPVPVDSAIVFAPSGEIVPIALRSLKKGGTVSLAGIHMTPVPSLAYDECLFHEKTLTTVEANTRDDGRAFLVEASAAGLKPAIVTYPLEKANDALRDLKRGAIQGTAVLLP